MTRYDPFSYGNVQIGKQGGAAGPAASPEDVLFADAGPVKQAPPAADDSWALMNEDVGSLLPGKKSSQGEAMDFGSEILGEAPMPAQAPARPSHKPATRAPAPAATRAPEAVLQMPASPRTAAASSPAARAAAAPAAAAAAAPAAKPAKAEARSAAKVPMRRSRPVAAMVAPLVMCAGGGTVASWMLVMQQNPVMAGIVAAITVVGAAFAWLLLRG